MFDIGFSEILVVGVVALIVIGPERLPKVARTLGHMFGRLQRYVNEVKADINREMELDELRKLQSEVQSAARSIEQSVTKAAHDVESGVRSVEAELNAAAGTTLPAAPAEASSALPAAPVPAVSDAVAEVCATDSHSQGAGDPPQQASLPGFERI
jgi:sec-independent protein translocase protein TatB